MTSRLKRIAAWASVLGILIIVLSVPLGPGGYCTAVGGGEGGEYRIQYIDWQNLTVHYTPDGGVNDCVAGFGAYTLPIGLLLIIISVPTVVILAGVDYLRRPP